MYGDPKLIKNHRVPVYLDGYVHERLLRLIEMTGGEKSAIGRDALERGLDLLESELHGSKCAQGAAQKRDVHRGYVCA